MTNKTYNITDYLSKLKRCLTINPVVYATQLTEDCYIKTMDNGILEGKVGEYLLSNVNGYCIITEQEFNETYQWKN